MRIAQLLLQMVWNVHQFPGLYSVHSTKILFRPSLNSILETRKMLDIGGSVADATIAGLLCEGVASPQSTGLGGGFVATIYNKAKNQAETLIARDVVIIILWL